MQFKIVNPSDLYTIEASSLDVAAVAAVLLGQGNYPFKSIDGGEDIPAFRFGGVDVWTQKHFSESLMALSNRMMDTKLPEIADCLDSVLIGDEKARQLFADRTQGMSREEFEKFRFKRHDEMLSSANDIGGRAYRMAAKLRESLKENLSTVQ